MNKTAAIAIRRLILLFVLFIYTISAASADNNPYGARPIAMANSSVMLGGLWSLRHNQAGITDIKEKAIGIFYENKYMIKDLSFKSFCFVLPFNKLSVGGDISHYGFSSLNDIKANLVIARQLSENISLGIAAGYNNISLGNDYGNRGTFYAACGIRATPFKKLFLGASIFNPGMSSVPFAEDYQLPTVLKTGAGYRFADKFLITSEYCKYLDRKAQWKSGVEAHLADNLWLRGGINYSEATYTFGVGYLLSPITIDMAFTNHQVLGYSAHASVSYTFASKK